jgi:hypothetical protein
MKKVTFSGKPPTDPPTPGDVDAWVMNRETAEPVQTRQAAPKAERTKRLTIDVSISLHKRIKSQCALRDEQMVDVIRDLLEKQFPRNAEEESRRNHDSS